MFRYEHLIQDMINYFIFTKFYKAIIEETIGKIRWGEGPPPLFKICDSVVCVPSEVVNNPVMNYQKTMVPGKQIMC